jgi:hypothetical protein
VTRDGWVQYAEFARRLDLVRAEELARTAGIREGVAQMSTHADELERRLQVQSGALTHVANVLRFRRPKLTPVPPQDPFLEPATALTTLARTIDVVDTEATQAADRGNRPTLLPAMTPTVRSLAVYGVAAALIVLLQGLAFRSTGDKTNPFLVLFLIPLIGFAVAYLVLTIGGRTRSSQEPTERRTRMGFLICFAIGPIAAVIVIATSFGGK